MSTALMVRPQFISLPRLRIAAYNASLAARGIPSFSTSDCYFGLARSGGTFPKQPHQTARVDAGPKLREMINDAQIHPKTLELLQMLDKEFSNS